MVLTETGSRAWGLNGHRDPDLGGFGKCPERSDRFIPDAAARAYSVVLMPRITAV